MNVKITFKNFDHTQALDSLINKKSKKIKKFFQTPVNMNWTCYTDSNEHHTEVMISGFSGPEIKVSAKSDNLYKTVDLALEKLEQKIKKRRKFMNKKSRTTLQFMEAS